MLDIFLAGCGESFLLGRAVFSFWGGHLVGGHFDDLCLFVFQDLQLYLKKLDVALTERSSRKQRAFRIETHSLLTLYITDKSGAEVFHLSSTLFLQFHC